MILRPFHFRPSVAPSPSVMRAAAIRPASLVIFLVLCLSLLFPGVTAAQSPGDRELLYSSYFGGDGFALDVGYGIATDAAGATYIAGVTGSEDFPIANAAQPVNPGEFSGFVAKFDPDGTLAYSTYLGGSGVDQIESVAVDDAGRAWVTGYTRSIDFPVTADAFQVVPGGGNSADAFLARYGPAGELEYATYLGGLGWDRAMELVLGRDGYVYITGFTGSVNFPVVDAFQPIKSLTGDDAFLTKFSPTGAVVYSTYLGGSSTEVGEGLAVDAQGSPHVTGITLSTDFPTRDAVQPEPASGGDAFVTKLTPDGSELVYSTYFGGTSGDNAQDVAVDDHGNAYATGLTRSTNFPTTSTAPQPLAQGAFDAFALKLDSAGGLAYSTYVGGTRSEHGKAVAVDDSGAAYLTGETSSSNFPVASPIQAVLGNASGRDAYVTKLDPDGTKFVFSSFLGGRGEDSGAHIDLAADDSILLTGFTTSDDFPLAGDPFQSSLRGRIDAIRVLISPELTPINASFTERSARSGQYSDQTLFEARLTDSGGNPISEAEVTFELAGEESSRGFTASTDEDGIASVAPTLEEKPGPFQLIARYAGDGDRSSSTDTTSFTVEKEDTDVALAVSGRAQNMTLEARLSDRDTPSDGISRRTIDFYSDGELIGSEETDEVGASTTPVPPEHRGANRTYEAVFEGDDFYLGSSDTRLGKGGEDDGFADPRLLFI